MNKTTFRIFVSVLLTGIVGVIGMLVMSYDIGTMSYYYDKMSEEHYVNREYMTDIRTMLYEHQAVVAQHIVDSDECKEEYESQEQKLRNELRDVITAFGERISENEMEPLYHKVYSNYISYLRNVDIVLQLSAENKDATAGIYMTSNMADFINKINGNLSELDAYTMDELNQIKGKMDGLVHMARYGAIAMTAVIVIAVIVCLFYCVKVATQLERYKDDLEEEVKRQTKEIREHMEKMARIQNNTIIGMANLIESRDGDTGGHIKRTGSYVELLAREAQKKEGYSDILTDEYIELLVKAAPMHDIGKIAVPDNILKKPGKLTPEEFESIKSHASEGGRIIRDVLGNIEEKEYVDIAAQVAEGHHEKWDGSGYPLGLKGAEIPLCARIMALADVFDALVSPRCYKEPFEPEKAFAIIEESAGKHFDPVLAQLFIELKEKVVEIMLAERD